MAGIMDYLDWRGDLTFDLDPFNEVDNLILAQLSYVELDGYVPGIGNRNAVTIKSVSERFFNDHTEEELLAVNTFIRLAPFVLKKMAATKRFGDAKLSNYVNHIDYNKNKQFSAMHISLGDRTTYVAYRGTDDTIVGWKEDFMMCYQTVPSQLAAVEYLERTAPFGFGKLRLGGHSKGGNLAVYAGVKCKPSIQKRILEIYSNDGPGFSPEFVEDPAYQKMLTKIEGYTPEFSVIGRLLTHGENYQVVQSTERLLLQHDAMSWQVLGNEFIHLDEVSDRSLALDERISSWINGMDLETRKQVVDGFFTAVESTGAKTLTDIQATKWKNIPKLIMSFTSLNDTVKGQIFEILKG